MASTAASATPDWSGPRPFVGQERHLQTLDRALSAMRDGAGRSVFILGERGSGKHRLVARFLESVTRVDPPVGILELTAGERTGVWQALRARVTRRRRIRQFLTAVLPEWIDFIPVVGPVTTAIIRSVQTLRRRPAVSQPGSHTAARRRSGAVAALDDTLAESTGPLVLVVRRFERARDDELAGAFHAIRTLPHHPILFVATVTLEHGAPPDAVLDLIREAERYDSADILRLDPLAPADWTGAVERATGRPLPDPWRLWLARHEPLFPGALWSLLAHAQLRLGALTATPDGWDWTAEPPPPAGEGDAPAGGRPGGAAADAQPGGATADPATGSGAPGAPGAPAPTAAGTGTSTLDGLDPEDRDLLAAATADGGTFDTGATAAGARLDELELQDRLARLERAGWVRFIETRAAGDDLVDVYAVARPGLVEALRAWRREGPTGES